MSSRRDAEFTEYAQARLSWLRGLAYVLCQDTPINTATNTPLPAVRVGSNPSAIAITP